MNELKIITYQNQRILNTQQLAESYDTSVKRISQNFNTNKERYQEGKHYFFLQGEELSSFLQSAIAERKIKKLDQCIYGRKNALSFMPSR